MWLFPGLPRKWEALQQQDNDPNCFEDSESVKGGHSGPDQILTSPHRGLTKESYFHLRGVATYYNCVSCFGLMRLCGAATGFDSLFCRVLVCCALTWIVVRCLSKVSIRSFCGTRCSKDFSTPEKRFLKWVILLKRSLRSRKQDYFTHIAISWG
jgi:hypothetical protein